MLAKKNRLRSKDINYLMNKKRTIYGQWFSFFWLPKKHGTYQLSVCIGKNYLKKATQRNQLKRKIIGYIDAHSKSIIGDINLFVFITMNKQTRNTFPMKDQPNSIITNYARKFSPDWKHFLKEIEKQTMRE
jgi:ribonuclease P protein component